MNTDQIRREKIIKVYAAIITLMLFASAAGLVMYQDSVNGYKSSMDDERLKNEDLLSEKLSLEKEISKMIGDLKAMTSKNDQLNARWKEAMASLDGKDKKINAMTNENRQAKNLIAEVKDLRNFKGEVQSELDRVKSELANALSENIKLNADVASLRSENEGLYASIANLSQVAVNNSMVEATKGKKEKLTVSARKTQKVKVGFDLPEDMIGNLYFKMRTPAGEQVSSDKSTISYVESPIMSDMIASTENVFTGGVKKKHIEMTYQPDEKLACGIYNIDVYSGEQYLGTTRVRLK